MGHKWSGWPGAICLKCGGEMAMEGALADNWYDPATDTWRSELHKRLVYLCDNFCPKDMSPVAYAGVLVEIKKLEAIIKKGDGNGEAEDVREAGESSPSCDGVDGSSDRGG